MKKDKKTILIIDDELDLCDVMREYLESDELTVLVSCDGAQGLKRIQEDKPSLVVSDYRMPELNGLDLLKELKKLKIEVPVIWLTGQGSPELFREAWNNNVFDFYEKPFDLEKLKVSIHKALASSAKSKRKAA